MKKSLLVSTIFALVSAPVLAAPTFYGKANVSLQAADEGDGNNMEVVSNASRLGIKGSELLQDSGFEVIYQAEFEAYFDGDNGGNTLGQRNIFIGMKTGYGTLKAGKFDTPLKESQNKVDLFNDMEGDIKAVLTPNDTRANDIVNYISPTFLGAFTASLAYIPSENETIDDAASASLAFDQSGLFLAAAYDMNVGVEDEEVVRVVAQYTIGSLQLGGLYEFAEVDGQDDSKDGALVSLQYTVDKLALKLQHGWSDLQLEDGMSTSLGVDYALTKNFKVFTYYTLNESEIEVSGQEVESEYLGAGVEYKF